MRIANVKALLPLLLLLLVACGGKQPDPAADLGIVSGDEDLDFRADLDPAYAAGLRRCNRQDALGMLTRDGCLAGLREARRNFAAGGASYDSQEDCLKAVQILEFNLDIVLAQRYDWCDQHFANLHDRKGCRDAALEFYRHITAEEYCKQAPAPGAAKEETPKAPEKQIPQSSAAPRASTPKAPEPQVAEDTLLLEQPQAPREPQLFDRPKYDPRPAKKKAPAAAKPAATVIPASQPSQTEQPQAQSITPAPARESPESATLPASQFAAPSPPFVFPPAQAILPAPVTTPAPPPAPVTPEPGPPTPERTDLSLEHSPDMPARTTEQADPASSLEDDPLLPPLPRIAEPTPPFSPESRRGGDGTGALPPVPAIGSVIQPLVPGANLPPEEGRGQIPPELPQQVGKPFYAPQTRSATQDQKEEPIKSAPAAH